MHAFDIIGPVMVGPSSSHTAGVVRIGNVVRNILGSTPAHIRVKFHGSFAKTYTGHGSDKAIIGGCWATGPTTSESATAWRPPGRRVSTFRLRP